MPDCAEIIARYVLKKIKAVKDGRVGSWRDKARTYSASKRPTLPPLLVFPNLLAVILDFVFKAKKIDLDCEEARWAFYCYKPLCVDHGQRLGLVLKERPQGTPAEYVLEVAERVKDDADLVRDCVMPEATA